MFSFYLHKFNARSIDNCILEWITSKYNRNNSNSQLLSIRILVVCILFTISKLADQQLVHIANSYSYSDLFLTSVKPVY